MITFKLDFINQNCSQLQILITNYTFLKHLIIDYEIIII